MQTYFSCHITDQHITRHKISQYILLSILYTKSGPVTGGGQGSTIEGGPFYTIPSQKGGGIEIKQGDRDNAQEITASTKYIYRKSLSQRSLKGDVYLFLFFNVILKYNYILARIFCDKGLYLGNI